MRNPSVVVKYAQDVITAKRSTIAIYVLNVNMVIIKGDALGVLDARMADSNIIVMYVRNVNTVHTNNDVKYAIRVYMAVIEGIVLNVIAVSTADKNIIVVHAKVNVGVYRRNQKQHQNQHPVLKTRHANVGGANDAYMEILPTDAFAANNVRMAYIKLDVQHVALVIISATNIHARRACVYDRNAYMELIRRHARHVCRESARLVM